MQYLETFGKLMGILIPVIGALTWGIGRLLNNRAKAIANEMMIQQLEGRIDDLEKLVNRLEERIYNNHK